MKKLIAFPLALIIALVYSVVARNEPEDDGVYTV